MKSLLHLATNPGVYTPPAAPPAVPAEWNPLLAVSLALFSLAFLGAFAALALDQKRAALVCTVLVVVTAGGAVTIGATKIGANHDQVVAAQKKHDAATQARNAYDVAYESRIRDWLLNDYGITTDGGSVHTLRSGGQMVASTAHGQKMIHLVETTTHDLAVQVVGGDIVQPGSLDQ